uniref:Uncharacterized protein n=1 Tax=Tetranychus urticae TaxID=32264 RepID=T1JVI4_TETUR
MLTKLQTYVNIWNPHFFAQDSHIHH